MVIYCKNEQWYFHKILKNNRDKQLIKFLTFGTFFCLKDNGNKFFYSHYLLNIPTEYLITYFHLSIAFMQVSAASPGGRPPGNSRATPGHGTEFVLKSRPGDRGFSLHLYFAN
jgi:hypothetical protein